MGRVLFAIREAWALLIDGIGEAWRAFDWKGRWETWRWVCSPDYDPDAPLTMDVGRVDIPEGLSPLEFTKAWREAHLVKRG